MLNTILHIFYMSDKLALGLNLAFLVYAIILMATRSRAEYSSGKTLRWNLFCLLPLAASAAHFWFFAAGSAYLVLLEAYAAVYAPAVMIALFPLLAIKKPVFVIGNILTVLLCLAATLLTFSSASTHKNYTRMSMKDAYVALCDELEAGYIMNDWKKIDYEAIKSEGLPLVEQAEATGDTDKYYKALDDLTAAFHDGHMGLTVSDSESSYSLDKMNKLSDFGLSLLPLDDGTVIAVDVDDSCPIKEGTVITKWGGVPVAEAAQKIAPPIPQPVAANNDILKTIFLSGTGSGLVTVSYINEKGKEKEVTLNELESVGEPRAMHTLIQFLYHVGNKPLTPIMLNDDTGYIGITAEETDELNDLLGYLTGDHKKAREMFRDYLRELESKGMNKLIIDIRGNEGGYDDMSTAIASLFTKKQEFAFSLGTKDGSGYKKLSDHYVLADGEFSDIKVLLLTNMECASAGDGLVLYLSKLPNVTVAGLTEPTGCNQETGGHIHMPGGAEIDYPIGVVLDEKGDPNIDVDYTLKSRTPLDVKIPLDKEAALKIFADEDYELEWATEYIKTI